jgi:hypothetical protein
MGRAHPPHRTEPKLLLVQCSKTSTTLLLTRRHGATEAFPSHSTAQNSTKPKLRDSVPPCETQLFIALWSLTRTTPFLTRRRGATEAYPSYRTAQNLSSVPPCLRVKPYSIWFSAQRPTRRYGSHGATAGTKKSETVISLFCVPVLGRTRGLINIRGCLD